MIHNHVLSEDETVVQNGEGKEELMSEFLGRGFEQLASLLRAPSQKFKLQEELKAVTIEQGKREDMEEEKKFQLLKAKKAKRQQKRLALLDSQDSD